MKAINFNTNKGSLFIGLLFTFVAFLTSCSICSRSKHSVAGCTEHGYKYKVAAKDLHEGYKGQNDSLYITEAQFEDLLESTCR